jgi:Uma2 family endonuclease
MVQILNKTIPENRIILYPVTWKTYQSLINELGDDCHKRFAYNEGYLEIMSPLAIHENNNRFIESLLGVIVDELGINIKKLGSLTLKRDDLEKGVEPDSCYYIENEPRVRKCKKLDLNVDPPPDLVLEIDLTSGSLNKLPIYAAFGIPEIWRYKEDKLDVFILVENGYQKRDKSSNFPWFDLNKIPELIEQSLTEGETATLRDFRQYVKKEKSLGHISNSVDF